VESLRRRLRRLPEIVRPGDFAWLILFAALAAVSPTRSSAELQLLAALGLLQLAEPRLGFFGTPAGQWVAILGKLALGFLLMGVTGAITSSYYLILMLPVVSAATTLGGAGTLLVGVFACASYLSFLLYVDWSHEVIPPDQARELALRLLFLATLGFLTRQLVEASRTQARNYQRVAEQLAEANRNLLEAEAAVRRSERLAALGQMTAGLAHELRNPLGTMKASAEVLANTVSMENAVARELAGFIASEVDRTNSLISRFLDFARPMHLRRKPTEIAEVIDRAVDQLHVHQPPFPVTVYKNYSPDIRPLPLDGELMERVIYNLLLNAAQATPAGGAITVKTRPVDGLVELAVIDRGSGIDPAHRESIFNPFFTTKPDGVGLGLAIVAKIVDEHGGTMAVESEPGEGSVFRLLLPAALPE